MLLTTPFVNDSRVLRAAQALARAGYPLRIVATQGPGTPRLESRDGFRIERVEADPRLVGMLQASAGGLRRLLSQLRRLRRHAGPGTDTAEAESASGEGVFGPDAWMAAAGGDSDGSLMLRHPQAAALRLALRIFLALRWWRFFRSAWAAVRQDPADIYVAHDLDTLPLAVFAKSRLGGRVVYDSHELYTDQSVTPPPTRLWRGRWKLIERVLIGRVNAVITVCDSIAEELVDRYGIDRPAVVRNIPELAEQAGPANGDLRHRIGIDSSKRIALYLGGIQLNRRMEHLIEAVGPLPDVVLVLMGPGDPSYVEHLEHLAVRLGYPERVQIVGPVAPERVAETARDADLGLVILQRSSLSDWYCLPTKLFESIHAGLPVITNDWPELRRVVEGYGVGILCDSDHPAAITNAIRQLLSDVESYERMRENTHAAAAELNWQAESKRLLTLIGEVADGLPARP